MDTDRNKKPVVDCYYQQLIWRAPNAASMTTLLVLVDKAVADTRAIVTMLRTMTDVRCPSTLRV